jgi:cobalt-zinc-cadmium efflux system protein
MAVARERLLAVARHLSPWRLLRRDPRESDSGQPHPHNHHTHQLSGDRLRLAFLLTLGVLAVEILGGVLSHSLAVLSDAAHMLTDVAALGLAWFAAAQAHKPANDRWTYGYHRVGILTALINGVTLVVIALVIGFEAYRRLLSPQRVAPGIMLLVALVAIGVNLIIARQLRGDEANLNARAALLHVLGDIGAAVGVVIGAVVIALSGAAWVDPVVSVLIAALIGIGAFRLINETVAVLLEASPRGMAVAGVAQDMDGIEGVYAVHDLHIWTIGSGMRALSAHVVIADLPPSASAAILDQLGAMLRRRYRIAHTTIQFESTAHDSHEGYCACPPGAGDQLHCQLACDAAPDDGREADRREAGTHPHEHAHGTV